MDKSIANKIKRLREIESDGWSQLELARGFKISVAELTGDCVIALYLREFLTRAPTETVQAQ